MCPHALRGEIEGQPFNVERAAPGIDDAGRAALPLQEQLRITRDAGGKISWQRQRLVERVGMQRLGLSLGRRHRLEAVRATLLNTSCAVSDQPEVWQWVRSDSERASFGWNGFISFAHSIRAARSLATSMKKFMPIAQKNDRRGANRSMSRPASRPARTYSTPSASV